MSPPRVSSCQRQEGHSRLRHADNNQSMARNGSLLLNTRPACGAESVPGCCLITYTECGFRCVFLFCNGDLPPVFHSLQRGRVPGFLKRWDLLNRKDEDVRLLYWGLLEIRNNLNDFWCFFPPNQVIFVTSCMGAKTKTALNFDKMALNVGVAFTSVPCDQAQEIQIISTCKAANYYTAASLSKLSYCGWLVVVGSQKKKNPECTKWQKLATLLCCISHQSS